MPFPAEAPRFAPPRRLVALTAAANVPTFRTSPAVEVVVRSTLKSAGSAAVAEVPIVSNVWLYGNALDIEIAAETATASMERTAHTSSARRRVERIGDLKLEELEMKTGVQ